MKRVGWLIVLCGWLLAASAWAQTDKQALNEQLIVAARKSNAAAVKELLAKGADVNAKTEYGATPLFYACDRGNAEVVKLLLDAGADVNAQDTFYKSTPIIWAVQRDHAEVVKLLIEKAPQSKESTTGMAIAQGSTKSAKALLELGGFKPESLSAWLATAEKRGNAEIVEALKKAGAQPKPKSDYKVEPEQLKLYEGTFKNEQLEISFKVKDGKLTGTANGSELKMTPVAEHSFEPEGLSSTVTFKLENGKVTGLTLKGPGGELNLKKAESK